METIVQTGLEVWPLPLERYDELIERGILGTDDKVELLRGVLAAMTPQGAPQVDAIRWLNQVLVRGTDPRFEVQPQGPLRLSAANSEPEPDFRDRHRRPRQAANRRDRAARDRGLGQLAPR